MAGPQQWPPRWHALLTHWRYNDVIMGAIASQITSLTIVYSIVYSDADQRKHQSSASLAFVWGIHRGPVNSPLKWPVTRKMFPFDDVIMSYAKNVSIWWRHHGFSNISALWKMSPEHIFRLTWYDIALTGLIYVYMSYGLSKISKALKYIQICKHCKNIAQTVLTHWGRVTHICVCNLTIIGSDNGLSPGRRQAITWANVGILLIGPLGTNCSEMLIEIHPFSFKKIHLKMSSGKWRPFCLGLNVLKI